MRSLHVLAIFLLGWALAGPALAHDTVYYYYNDAQGTPVAMTDANGNVVERSQYEPYGQVLNRALRDGPGYTSHEEDPGTGLVYMQQRYYDPTVGRFLSMDPVDANTVTGGNFNRYAYANDNPYKYIDPDGRTCKKAGNDGYSCAVDDNAGKWSRSALKTVNRAYTQAVNTLLKNPDATAKIEVDGKSFTVSAKTVAKALIGTWVVTGNGHPRSRAETLGGTLTPNRGHNGMPKTTLYPNALSSDRSGGTAFIDSDLSRTFIHEGIHGTSSESTMIPLYRSDPSGFNDDHQRPYNAASDRLYDPIQISPAPLPFGQP